MNRKRKAMIRARLESRLDLAFSNLYHNATINYNPRDLPKDIDEYLSDAEQWEEITFSLSCRLDDVNTSKGGDYIEDYIASRYGTVYTYGRGGATCAPEDWIRTHGGSSFSIDAPDPSEMSRYSILALALDVEAWNAYVKAECSAENIAYILSYRYEEAKQAAREALEAKVNALITI